MGLVQTENIQITAEAYDVALDMSFPKGADGGLDFGTIRVVTDESKQSCSLKNKGRYDISFWYEKISSVLLTLVLNDLRFQNISQLNCWLLDCSRLHSSSIEFLKFSLHYHSNPLDDIDSQWF